MSTRVLPTQAAVDAYAEGSAAVPHLPGESLDHYLDRKRQAGLCRAFPVLLEQWLGEAFSLPADLTAAERLVTLASLSAADPAEQLRRRRLAERLFEVAVHERIVRLMMGDETTAAARGEVRP